ncbi:MAG TPA: hypothetical protein VHJ78_05190 [Actinomycetota bacterium]|nr:hypothetical protein [Actinomycetota bacterium]
MFKASIALVLLAFGALAYGWIAGNDVILYGSIGASALAGLALAGSHLGDRKSPAGSRADRDEPPARERKSTRRDEEPAPGRSDRRKSRGLDSGDITRQLDLDDEEDHDDLSDLARPPSVRPISGPAGRRRPLRVPEGADWASEDPLDEEPLDADYDRDQTVYDSGFQEEESPAAEQEQASASYRQGAAAADDFRSRLAAVLGQAPAPEEPPPPPAPKPARARRATPVEAPAEEPKPARRGRKKAEPVLPPPEEEPSAEREDEPDWIRLEDVPRIARATQPGGGFARPDTPEVVRPYRPRRPGVPKASADAEKPARPTQGRRTTSTASGAKTAAAKTAGTKPGTTSRSSSTAKPSVSRVSGATGKPPDPDAPKPRRGRPPKPKP